jgi:hypothetical protein
MPLLKLRVGPIAIISLSDGTGASFPTDIWPSVPADAWASLGAFLNPDGTHTFNYGSIGR